MSRPYTIEEMQELFLRNIRSQVDYWISLVKNGESTYENAIEGVAFSMLVIFDGESGGFPACDLIPSPHPDDKQYDLDKGKNYYPDGVNIIDGSLHEQFLNKYKQHQNDQEEGK